MKTVAVINQKGGVGKTTTTCNLSVALARLGLRVLAVDLDPQSHLSLHLNKDIPDEQATLYEVLVKGTPVRQAIVPVESAGLSLLPSHIDLSSAELELAGEIGRESILKTAFNDGKIDGDYDVALIDCPPSLGLLALNGLTAAQEVLIPLQAEFFSLHGIGRLLEVIEVVNRRLRKGPEVLGIVLCRLQKNTRLAREVLDELRQHFGDKLFQTSIHQNVRLAEASSHGQSIFSYDESSTGASDYESLARELTQRWDEQSQAASASS